MKLIIFFCLSHDNLKIKRAVDLVRDKHHSRRLNTQTSQKIVRKGNYLITNDDIFITRL